MSFIDPRVAEWTDPPKPMPDDFENFVPWACSQMLVETKVVVTRFTQSEYISVKSTPTGKTKKSKGPAHINSSTDTVNEQKFSTMPAMDSDSKIGIDAIYDTSHNLVQIKFLKNQTIPRKVFKIIGLIIRFQKYLNSIVINSGLTCEIIHEIAKILPLSRITEICLDHSYIKEANYDILLEQGFIKHLSLARCRINDVIVKNIASKLCYQQKAAKTLIALNLASNRITDVGAQYLADALRSNRQLGYLNLSDNMINDVGALSIFNVLMEFPLTSLEDHSRKTRLMIYLHRKLDLIIKKTKEVRASEDKKNLKRRVTKTIVMAKKKNWEKDNNSGSGTAQHTRSIPNIEPLFSDKAANIVEDMIGPFVDPFDDSSIFVKDHKTYCYGNNVLCHLNMAYNNLTYNSIKKLRNVVMSQHVHGRKPRGLINVRLEGNYLPISCKELTEIDDMLESGLSETTRPSEAKKRVSKVGSAKSTGIF
ncbi:leucine-rich repeat-containing protein 71-like [Spodoptera litura]|uniref:Leucine-rich repeat-containing protein 71-like n=1 Tax=Spodoptera litura TaxID=69820 RepID=A0A9J7EW87_SPOLT|nr:leucine-rich repeat-containing protein 71-like [Spodoptera litura]